MVGLAVENNVKLNINCNGTKIVFDCYVPKMNSDIVIEVKNGKEKPKKIFCAAPILGISKPKCHNNGFESAVTVNQDVIRNTTTFETSFYRQYENIALDAKCCYNEKNCHNATFAKRCEYK